MSNAQNDKIIDDKRDKVEWETIYEQTKIDRHKLDCYDDLLKALILAKKHLDYCDYGDEWERECAKENKLSDKIQQAINKAEEPS